MSFIIQENRVWEVTDQDGRKYILKKTPDGLFIVGQMLEYETDELVAQIVKTRKAPIWITTPTEAVCWYQTKVEETPKGEKTK